MSLCPPQCHPHLCWPSRFIPLFWAVGLWGVEGYSLDSGLINRALNSSPSFQWCDLEQAAQPH